MEEIPILSIVGRSGSGKTTLIEKLIPEFRERGYRVATIKHVPHGFEADREGKDSWRHKQAGARVTVLASRDKIALFENAQRSYSAEEIRDRYIRDVDLVISEGYKGNPYSKIEVFRSSVHPRPLCDEGDLLLASVGESVGEGIPCFRIDEIPELVDLIVSRLLKKK
ncbi:MAG: molybdopterin-guanine dinucleotide biosynthesis protein B [Syntrophales bacterium]|nr:molybdopterin-guanine dinucleotide biosynthesis protein B [Syntrophales bacterium]MDD5232001.1 molybdopterin-guanine dinucleotide biosynthesis protein B [Syntrophales bacterium]MDD5532029.1 molybdopterin-guanine dinucleotide biosynthesis protein B [Syntrophales bacterium]HPL64373.1 molybdopterin-guanine dinucleotide biosynthesis protein B [Syntrophales bacterium]